jgi:DNA-directed RNA polymerase subunit M/transcription elongation factor TFIIS
LPTQTLFALPKTVRTVCRIDINGLISKLTLSIVNDDIAQFYLQPSDYQNTTVSSQLRSSSSTATSSTYLFDQTLETPVNQSLHPRVLNQGPHSAAPMQQDPAMGTFLWERIDNSLSSMNDGVTSGSMMGSRESSMLDRKKTSNARVFRRRRYHPRHIPNRKAPQSSASGGIKNGTPIPSKTPTMPRDNMISRSMTEVDKMKDDHVDPERALNLLKRSIETQPYSSISQREMAALIKKIEDVVLREKMYGSSSSDSGEVTIPSTVSDSISNSESIEPEYSSDATSMSSTPRLPVDETPDAEAAEAQTVHKVNCPHCGNKPNYYCSKSGCGYFAHTRGDAKRHEEGEKHYPQARFMCCECPLAHAQLTHFVLILGFCEHITCIVQMPRIWARHSAGRITLFNTFEKSTTSSTTLSTSSHPGTRLPATGRGNVLGVQKHFRLGKNE